MTNERFLIEELLRIPDKEGMDVDFILNADQAAYDAAWTSRDIIAKYRQGGFSTYPLGRALVRCLAYRNRRHVIIAHNTDTTQKLLSRIHYMVKHFKGPEPVFKYATQNRLVFGKTDSSIYIGTAGNEDYGVGDTITDLHCSEVSRWDNADALLSGLFQAVPPSGSILLESTGRGTGNWFHKAVMRAQRGGSYKLHFFNWLNTPEYDLALTETQKKEILDNLHPDEEKIVNRLTPGQLAFRRLKLEELNYDSRAFQENYPLSLEECFQATGFGVFHKVNFAADERWRARDPWTWVLGDHPSVAGGYIFGVDTAGGGGLDYSVIEGIDANTGEQVVEYRNNMIEPDRFARKVYELGRKFNDAYLNVERNNHGIVVIKELLNLGYPQGRLYRSKNRVSPGRSSSELAALSDFGTYTTEVVKAVMIGELQKQVREDWLLHSEVLKLEMGSFIETDTGRMEASKGCFDDCVMAAALAAYVRIRAVRLFNNLAEEEMKGRGLRRNEVFEAGRAIAELEERYNSRVGFEAGLPIENHLDWV